MDQITINAVEDMLRMDLDRDAAAMLIVQSDEPSEVAEAQIATIEQTCGLHGATEVYATSDPDESEALVEARRQAIPAMERRGAMLLEDVGVPLPRLGDLIEGMRAIAEQRGIEIAVVAHAGDGNTHPLIVLDPEDATQRASADLAFGEVMTLAIDLGGTITGEHGVGRLKQPWLADYLGDDVLELNLRIKKALDPQNILTPGAMFGRG
jgi:glycolate oxidase